MKRHLVRVSGEEIHWLAECPCCGDEAGEWLRIPNLHGLPDEVPMHWQVPFCARCVCHAQPIANIDDFCRDAGVYSMVWFVLYLVARVLARFYLSRKRTEGCACTEPAVRHWFENRVGSHDPGFEFARSDYATRFAACNPTLPYPEPGARL